MQTYLNTILYSTQFSFCTFYSVEQGSKNVTIFMKDCQTSGCWKHKVPPPLLNWVVWKIIKKALQSKRRKYFYYYYISILPVCVHACLCKSPCAFSNLQEICPLQFEMSTLCDDPSDDIDDKYFLWPASFQVHDSPEPENFVCPPTCEWYLVFQRRIDADRRNIFRLDSRLEHL